MPNYPRAADAAKRLLRTASHQLMTPDPTADRAVSQALDQSLDWMVNDPNLRAGTGRSFEPSFSETTGRSLAFQVQPAGRGVTFQDQHDISNGAARAMIHEHFGASPLNWFDAKSESARARYSSTKGFGARYALGLDRNGLTEVQASYEWGPSVMDMLPDPVLGLAQVAMSALPGLQPFATTIRCGRMSGGQQISFQVTRSTPLDAFLPLMQELGMAERHGGFMTLLAFVMGAQFTLPADVATLTLLQTPKGPELRLDVNIDALPDAPEQLLPLLRLPMTERPQNLAALDAWMTAMTPDGYYGPGAVTVLSVRVRADLPARLALFLRPLAMDPAQQPAPMPPVAMPQSAYAALGRARI
jgi:hypothetical protein